MWLTDLARLADPKYGLVVRFENGWGRRGASGGAQMKAVAGALWHHDVAPRSGTYPLRHMLRDGRKGLSGPLAHIGFDRDGVVHVIGAGKANHAGTGKVPGVVRNGGNTRLIGIEMTSAGTRPWDWTPAQLRQMPRLGAALGDIFGYGPSQNWAHYEYSDGGKIDPAGLPGAMPGLRSRIGAVRFGGISGGGATVPRPSVPTSRPPVPASPTFADVDKTQAWLRDLGYDPGPIDGIFGGKTETATRQAQHDLGITPADGKPGPATRKELADMASKIDTLLNEVRAIPGKVLTTTVPNEGMHKGGRTDLRTKVGWQAHNFTQTHQLLAAQAGRIDGLTKAVEQLASAQGLDPAAISAAVEAGVTASLGNLEVTVTKGE